MTADVGIRSLPVSPMRTQGRVIYALMLRDIRTRFFGHGLGYLLMLAWPLTHMMSMLIIFVLGNRVVPYGESLVVFLSTGILPFIAFSYVSRFTMYALSVNKPLLNFPVVKVLDLLIARALLEILAFALIIAIFMIVLWFFGHSLWPRDFLEACYALGACLLLGFGYGVCNGIIAMAVKSWLMIYTLIILVFYATSGIMFIPDQLPETIRDVLAYNPLLQCVEWLRSAYYDGYGSILLSKSYVISCAVGATCWGLILERLVRGRLLQN